MFFKAEESFSRADYDVFVRIQLCNYSFTLRWVHHGECTIKPYAYQLEFATTSHVFKVSWHDWHWCVRTGTGTSTGTGTDTGQRSCDWQPALLAPDPAIAHEVSAL